MYYKEDENWENLIRGPALPSLYKIFASIAYGVPFGYTKTFMHLPLVKRGLVYQPVSEGCQQGTMLGFCQVDRPPW